MRMVFTASAAPPVATSKNRSPVALSLSKMLLASARKELAANSMMSLSNSLRSRVELITVLAAAKASRRRSSSWTSPGTAAFFGFTGRGDFAFDFPAPLAPVFLLAAGPIKDPAQLWPAKRNVRARPANQPPDRGRPRRPSTRCWPPPPHPPRPPLHGPFQRWKRRNLWPKADASRTANFGPSLPDGRQKPGVRR